MTEQQFTLGKFPEMVPDGTILIMGLRYEGQTTDKVWTYTLLKAGGLWYVSGNDKTPTAAGWGAVERWLAKDGREVLWVQAVTETVEIYPVPGAPEKSGMWLAASAIASQVDTSQASE